MQIKTFFFILSVFYCLELCAQKDKVTLGTKKETDKDNKNKVKSGFIKIYPFNLLRGDLSLGFEYPLSRYFSIEPIVCMTFKNHAEYRLNYETNFAEQSYISILTFDNPEYKFIPSFGYKGTIKLYPKGHDDLDGDYYALGYGHKNYRIRQNLDFGNGKTSITTGVEDTEYKFMRGWNMMNKKNFNFELGVGTGIRDIKFVKQSLEEIYDPQTQQRHTELVSTKVNYQSLILLLYFNLGINIL